MPNWKKLITSGSAASLSSLTTSGNISGSSTSTGSIAYLEVADKLELGGPGSQFFAFNEDTIKVKFANWYSSNDRQYGMGQLYFETWFAAIDNQASRDERRIGFYLEEPNAGSTDSGTPGQHPTNSRFHIDINGGYLSGSLEVSEGLTLGTALPVSQGGTGATSLTSNKVLTGNGTSAIQAEGNLSFNGSELGVTGGVDITGTYQTNNVVAINSDGNFEVHDNRATSGSTDLGLKGVRFDFKNNSADGLSDGGTYHGLMTIQQWNDTSGGHTHNLGFTDNGYIWHRNASIGGSWGNWKKLIQEDESGNVAIENGDLRASQDVIAYYSSDKRLKDNIVRIENPLEKIDKIGGYTFDWNDKQETYTGKDVGVIAQEIQEVLPELVTERDNGYLAVKYEKIVPLLIESIKELKQEVDEIKQKCDCLNK